MTDSINTDEEFLLWIASRLVFKYKENSSIIDRVKFIIEKDKLIKNVLDSNNISLTKAISETIQYLDSIKTKNQSEIKLLSSKFREIKLNNNIVNLENADIDYILKGVLKWTPKRIHDMSKKAKNFVVDNLSNQIHHLIKALDQIKKIINTLEIENKELENQIKFLLEKI